MIRYGMRYVYATSKCWRITGWIYRTETNWKLAKKNKKINV